MQVSDLGFPHLEEGLTGYRFLVTGGAGFIGSHLVQFLLENEASLVRVVDNLSTGNIKNLAHLRRYKQLQFEPSDITNLSHCHSACQGIDIVLHQAALGSVPRSILYPDATHAANVTGFINMLIAAKEAKVKRVVYASSSSVYGNDTHWPKTEEFTGTPLSPYAATKAMNEMYADIFARTYGMELVGLRYFNVFGPRQDPHGAYAAVIPLFMKAFLSGVSPQINGDGSNSRDFTYIQNVVQANMRAAFTRNLEAINTAYNVAAGVQTSLTELAQYIQELLKTDIELNYGPNRAGDIPHSLADISKAQNLLGYEPKIGIKEGLGIALNWYKQQLVQ